MAIWPFKRKPAEPTQTLASRGYAGQPDYDQMFSQFMHSGNAANAIRDFHLRLLILEGKAGEANRLKALAGLPVE